MISIGPDGQPLFTHLGCSFLTPGGSIVDFVTMAVAAPALECHYSGLYLINPGTEYVCDNELIEVKEEGPLQVYVSPLL